MPEIDPVILQLQADLKQYRSDLTGAQRLTETKLAAIEARGVAMGQNIRKGFDLAKGAAIGFLATVSVDALTQAAKRGLDYASSLGEVAQQLGVTTDALQEYRYAASQAGLSQEEMDQALSQLTRRIGEAASGTKAQAEAFTKLGISVKDANGNVMDAGRAIPIIADALQKIESPAERAAILMDLFGRAGQKLEPLLSGGSAAVNELRDAAHKLGIVLSEDQIQRADETADKLAALKQVLEARIAGAVSDNASAILSLANALASLVDWAGKAANAYRRFKLEQGLRESQAMQTGWFRSDADRAKGKRDEQLYRYEIAKMDGKVDTTGGFRDYRITGIGGASATPAPGAVATSATTKKTKAATAGPSGPSAAEIMARIDSQLASMAQQALSAMESVAKSADERAELELRSVELARVRALREVDTDTDLDRLGKEEAANQRARLKTQIEALADAERDRIEQRRKAELEQDARDLAQERYNTDRDGLQIQYDLADSQTERKRLALEMLDLELRYQKALLEGVIASETATEAEKKRAQAALDGLNATASGKREAASRSNETPLEAYRRKLDRSPDAINEQVESYVVEELDNVRDGIRGALEKVIGTDDPLISGLLNLLIEQVILRPLAEALASASGGGGGFFGAVASGIGSLFGRASGGYVAPGQMVRVNEGASPGRVEGFIPQGGGHIVPLGRMNALRQAGGQKVFQISIDARNSVTPDGFARELSSQILRQAAAMDGQTAQAVLKAAPGRMSQYQRDKI